jgi:hypothetical protein
MMNEDSDLAQSDPIDDWAGQIPVASDLAESKLETNL